MIIVYNHLTNRKTAYVDVIDCAKCLGINVFKLLYYIKRNVVWKGLSFYERIGVDD